MLIIIYAWKIIAFLPDNRTGILSIVQTLIQSLESEPQPS